MSFTTTTPFMNLVLPEPTLELGPAWASELNIALFLVDSHNHTPGRGEPIPTSGLNINSDLTLNSFNSIGVRSVRFVNQGSPLSLATDLGCIYESGGDFWYNNSIGQQVKITSGASLNASSIGGIGGDYVTSGALVFYTSGTSSYSMTTDGTNFANLLSGALSIYPTGTSSFSITLQVPSLSSSKILTLPLPPVSTSFLQINPSGVITGTISTTGGIVGSNIASNTITTSNIITRVNSNTTINTSTSSTSPVTWATLTATFTGSPCFVGFSPVNPNSGINIVNGGGAGEGFINVLIDSVLTYSWTYSNPTADSPAVHWFGLPGPLFLPSGLSAGSHTITIQAICLTTGTVFGLSQALFYIYESI